jgi:hypothetical protein
MIEKPTIDELKDTGNVPRVHGNGFIQLDLGPGVRLHIWGHPALVRQRHDTSVHDHLFPFVSNVLVGRIVNRIVHTYERPGADDYKIYNPVARDGEDTVLVDSGIRVHIYNGPVQIIEAGGSYQVKPFVFHESFTDRPSATIMVKGKRQNGVARVLVPEGVEPDNAFNRNTALSVQQMWSIIEDVLWH